jgi:hypothetical protein
MLVVILLCAKLCGMLSDVSSTDELDIARGGWSVMLILTDLFQHTLREIGKPYMDLLSVILSVT